MVKGKVLIWGIVLGLKATEFTLLDYDSDFKKRDTNTMFDFKERDTNNMLSQIAKCWCHTFLVIRLILPSFRTVCLSVDGFGAHRKVYGYNGLQ